MAQHPARAAGHGGRPGIAAQSLPTLLAQGGGVTLVDFVYTRCQTVCLSLGSSFQQLQAALQTDRNAGATSTVRLLSISFDGAHDTPAVLQAYARALQADLALWHWVRVPDAVEQQALLQRLGVVVVPDGRGDLRAQRGLSGAGRPGPHGAVFDLAEQQWALDFARHLAKGRL